MHDRSNRTSKVLLIVGVVCLCIGLMPGRSKYTDGETQDRVTEWRIGLSFSPLWEYRRRDTATGYESEDGFRLPSWSWLPLLVGTACLKLRPTHIAVNNGQSPKSEES